MQTAGVYRVRVSEWAQVKVNTAGIGLRGCFNRAEGPNSMPPTGTGLSTSRGVGREDRCYRRAFVVVVFVVLVAAVLPNAATVTRAKGRVQTGLERKTNARSSVAVTPVKKHRNMQVAFRRCTCMNTTAIHSSPLRRSNHAAASFSNLLNGPVVAAPVLTPILALHTTGGAADRRTAMGL